MIVGCLQSIFRLPRLFFAAGATIIFCASTGTTAEVPFADFNDQGYFNNFSGDSGLFASDKAGISSSFDPRVYHGSNGSALRIEYNVPSGFCGLWNSLFGKLTFPKYSLNFTNLFDGLRNSAGNPSHVENVHVTSFRFWARGNGDGAFDHQVKIEFKDARGQLVGSRVFAVSNQTNWARYEFPVSDLDQKDLSQMKEVVFVIEDWRNDHRSGLFFLDDLAFETDAVPNAPFYWTDDAMLDIVEQRAFYYFLQFSDNLGFALDRSTFSDMVSSGTIGFELSAFCVGHERGWADRADLENRVVKILENLNQLSMGPDPGTSRGGYRGFYYHFLTANLGTRKDTRVELSLYDTALLMYGVLTCKEYFPTNTQIQEVSRQLFDRVEWDWFVDHSSGRGSNQFHLAWSPGPTAEGTFSGHVDGQTDEALMVDILALGSKTHPTSPATCFARSRVLGSYHSSGPANILATWKGSLFNYFFANCWVNLQSRGPDLDPVLPRDIWENDRMAIIANRQFCIDHARGPGDTADNHFKTYGPDTWGLTSCDNLVRPTPNVTSEYCVFGALPAEENIRFRTRAFHLGTIPVYGAASCINFMPAESIAALRHDFEIPGLWNPFFGFGDAFSLDPHYLGTVYDADGNPEIFPADFLNGSWVNHMTMGVDVGPMLLAIENHRSGLMWKLTAHNTEIQAGLDRIFGVGGQVHYNASLEHHSAGRVMHLHWKPVPGASSYSVYTSTDRVNWKLQENGIHGTDWTDPKMWNGTQRFYCLKAVE